MFWEYSAKGICGLCCCRYITTTTVAKLSFPPPSDEMVVAAEERPSGLARDTNILGLMSRF
jgi:hypothetical protein